MVGAWVPSLGPTGETLYDVVNKNDGTLTNMDPATDWVVGENGYALDFDGADDYVALGKIATLGPKGSILFRLKINSNSGSHGIGRFSVADGSRETFYPFSGDNLYIGLLCGSSERPISGVSNSSFDKTEWHTLCVTAEQGTGNYKLYQNASLNASGTMSGGVGLHATLNQLGASSGAKLAGQVAEVLIYSRVLSQPEIQKLYTDHLAPFRRKQFIPTGGGEVAAGVTIPIFHHHYQTMRMA